MIDDETRHCLYCGDVIVRRPDESPSKYRKRRACSNSCSAFVRNMKIKQEKVVQMHSCPLCKTEFELTADQRWRIKHDVSLIFCSKECSKKGIGLARQFNANKLQREQDRFAFVAANLNSVLFSWMGVSL